MEEKLRCKLEHWKIWLTDDFDFGESHHFIHPVGPDKLSYLILVFFRLSYTHYSSFRFNKKLVLLQAASYEFLY